MARCYRLLCHGLAGDMAVVQTGAGKWREVEEGLEGREGEETECCTEERVSGRWLGRGGGH